MTLVERLLSAWSWGLISCLVMLAHSVAMRRQEKHHEDALARRDRETS